MPVADESVGNSESQSERQIIVNGNALLETVALSGFRLTNPGREAEEVQGGS